LHKIHPKLHFQFGNLLKGGLIILISFLVIFTIVKAVPPISPYQPGETLEPNCAPGETNCTVIAPTISNGTANYIPKFTDDTTIANSVIYESENNIGIGTTTPAYKLDINGALRLQPSSAPIDGNGVIYYDSTANQFKFYQNGGWQEFLHLDQTTPQIIINGIPFLDEHRNFTEIHQLVDKKYVDEAVTAIGARYYMTDNSDPTGYKLCSLAVPTESETYYEKSGLNNNDYIMGWISAEGERPAKLIKGVYSWRIMLERSAGNKTLRVFWKLVELKADNSEVVIATSANSNIITNKSYFEVPLVLGEDYQPADDSRIVGKVYAVVSGSGTAPTIRIYYRGNSTSHWEIPTNLEVLTEMFIPYTGATKNVDLGANDFTVATSTLFVDSAAQKVGIGTTTPAYSLHILGNGSSTIAIGDATHPGCIVMGDSDGGGVTYLYTLDGVLYATTTKPDFCQ